MLTPTILFNRVIREKTISYIFAAARRVADETEGKIFIYWNEREISQIVAYFQMKTCNLFTSINGSPLEN